MTEPHTPPATYILRELHDVAVPESVSWMPQTIGWKILAAVGIFTLICFICRFIRQRWNNRYRREATVAITRLEPAHNDMPKTLFTILKMVLIYLDSSNASLFDIALLKKLDETNPKGPPFCDDVAKRWLQSLMDPSVELDHAQRVVLLERAAKWVKHHG